MSDSRELSTLCHMKRMILDISTKVSNLLKFHCYSSLHVLCSSTVPESCSILESLTEHSIIRIITASLCACKLLRRPDLSKVHLVDFWSIALPWV